MKNLKTLSIGGVSYNIGWSENDFTTAYKTMVDNMSTDIAAAKSEAIAAGVVSIDESAGTGDILKKYVFSQNGAEIGTINLAKDLVVSGGEIVEKEGVKYLSLTIANQEAPVEIPVADLVDVYTGSTYISISDDNQVSVNFDALDSALAADTAAVGAAIKAADAKGAQGISDAAAASAAVATEQSRAEGVEAGLRSDLGQSDASAGTDSAFARIKSLEAEIESLSDGAGSIANQIDEKIATYDTATVQPISEVANAANTTANANKTKLDGISEGANKVTMTVEDEVLVVTIA